MSVSDEKMLILKMLEEGKITSEEAAKLIDALGNDRKQGPDQSNSRQEEQSRSSGNTSKANDGFGDWKTDSRGKKGNRDFDRVMDDFSIKVEKLGRNLAETTFGLVDKVTDFVGSFVDTNSFRYFGGCPAVDKTFDAEASEGMVLNVEGVNGQIVVKKGIENKIIINSRIRSHMNNPVEVLVFENTGNTVSLKLNQPANMSVSHEILLPEIRFREIHLLTTNAKIYIEDSLSDDLTAVTKNGQIELMGANCGRISLNTRNSRIQTGYVTVRDMELGTSNSSIDIKHIKAGSVKAVTTNSRVTLEDAQNYEGSNELNLSLKNTNGRIKINMNDEESRGYRIKAQTTHGQINLLMPDMLYSNIGRQGFGGSTIETQSNNFESYAKKVYINAETTNSYIEIGK